MTALKMLRQTKRVGGESIEISYRRRLTVEEHNVQVTPTLLISLDHGAIGSGKRRDRLSSDRILEVVNCAMECVTMQANIVERHAGYTYQS
jgi:hypothetical protein